MPVPHSLADLSTEETVNSPQGGDQIGGQLDDYLRGHAVIMKRDLAPALTAAGTSVTPTGAIAATDAQAALAALDSRSTASDAALVTHKTSGDHDARYYTQAQTDTALAAKQPTGDYATNTALNNGLATKQPAGNYAAVGTGITNLTSQVEFGAVNLAITGGSQADLPANWIMTGIRYIEPSAGEKYLYIHGAQFKV